MNQRRATSCFPLIAIRSNRISSTDFLILLLHSHVVDVGEKISFRSALSRKKSYSENRKNGVLRERSCDSLSTN